MDADERGWSIELPVVRNGLSSALISVYLWLNCFLHENERQDG
jgi:hypothetical protein